MVVNGFLITFPTRLTISKASYSYPYLSIPFKAVKSQLSSYCCCSSISFPSVFYMNKKETLLRVSVIAAQQGGNNPAVLEEVRGVEVLQGIANWDISENEAVGEESDDAVEAVGDAGEDDGYVEPPEEAKVFVGNLPYDVDGEKLAQIFEQAGVVEISEVIYNRETDQSRGFGFVTMSTVEEAEKPVEMFYRYVAKCWCWKMVG